MAGGDRVAPDDALALDGKTLRGIHGDAVPGVHLVAAYAHQAGAVLAQAPLTGRLVTGDALLTQRDVSARIVASGGDYLLPVDANQPALLAACEAAFPPVESDGDGRVGDPSCARLPGSSERSKRVPKIAGSTPPQFSAAASESSPSSCAVSGQTSTA